MSEYKNKNKKYKNISNDIEVNSDIIIQEIKEEIKKDKSFTFFKTPKQNFTEFIYSNNNFVIYLGDVIIFDSTITNKDKIIILKEGFQIFNKIYSFNGIRIKNK